MSHVGVRSGWPVLMTPRVVSYFDSCFVAWLVSTTAEPAKCLKKMVPENWFCAPLLTLRDCFKGMLDGSLLKQLCAGGTS